ncbi:hypothetical protein JCM11491_006362 [Sporobolomyces phaffii]
MSLSSLPTELLRAIVDHAGGPLPSRTEQAHVERTSTLIALSLTSRALRYHAQAALTEEVWIKASDTGWDRVAKAFDEFDFGKPRCLSVKGDGPETYHIPFFSRTWLKNAISRTARIRLDGVTVGFEALVMMFASLQTLELEDTVVVCLSPGNYFSNLRRLVLGLHVSLESQAESDHFRQTFSPTFLPNVVHLALGLSGGEATAVPESFSLLFPQLKTFAIATRNWDFQLAEIVWVLGLVVDSMPKLEHLSLDFECWDGWAIERSLFDFAAGLELKSLHLGWFLEMEEGVAARLAKVARGEKETIAVENIVVYALKGPKRNRKRDKYSEAFNFGSRQSLSKE